MLKSQVELWAEPHQSEPPNPPDPNPEPKPVDTMDEEVPAPDDE